MFIIRLGALFPRKIIEMQLLGSQSHFVCLLVTIREPNGVVSIATGYGLDGLGIESR